MRVVAEESLAFCACDMVMMMASAPSVNDFRRQESCTMLRRRAHELAAKPLFESGLADGGVIVGHERALAKFRSVVARVCICDH